jgi:hypothetical protein
MLDAYVIEEIKRREREKGREERPVAELPVPGPAGAPEPEGGERDESPDRGVVIIDYSGQG